MQAKLSTSARFINERDPSQELTVSYTNWGDPYAEGVRFTMREGEQQVDVDLERHELRALHTMLGRLIDTLR